MAVDFRINDLGGLNLGQSVRQGYDIYQQQRQNTMQDEALAKQEMQQEELQGLMAGAAKGDPEAIETLYSRNPKLAAQFEQRDLVRAEREGQQAAQASKQREVEFATRYRAASPEQKSALLQEAAADSMIDIDDEDLALNPEQAEAAVNLMLFQNLGKDGYKALVTDTQPEITTEYQQGMLDAKKVDQDLRREELELKKLQAQQRKAKNEIEREQKQVAIDEKRQKIEQEKADYISNAQNAYSQANDTIGLIKKIKNSPGFAGAVGSKGIESLFGVLDNPIPGTDAADTALLLETLDSKNFLNAIQQMRGMGSLSNTEGAKVSAAVQNLSRNQSEKQLQENLNNIIQITERGLKSAEEKIKSKGGDVPTDESEKNNGKFTSPSGISYTVSEG